MSWALEVLKDVVGWGLAFWFIPVSYLLCKKGSSPDQKKEAGAKETRDASEVTRTSKTKKDHGHGHVLAKAARLSRPKV